MASRGCPAAGGAGGQGVPFHVENEIPVRLSQFYDIFISWAHVSRRIAGIVAARLPPPISAADGRKENPERRAAIGRASAETIQAAIEGRS
jgi:hypothetical protein